MGRAHKPCPGLRPPLLLSRPGGLACSIAARLSVACEHMGTSSYAYSDTEALSAQRLTHRESRVGRHVTRSHSSNMSSSNTSDMRPAAICQSYPRAVTDLSRARSCRWHMVSGVQNTTSSQRAPYVLPIRSQLSRSAPRSAQTSTMTDCSAFRWCSARRASMNDSRLALASSVRIASAVNTRHPACDAAHFDLPEPGSPQVKIIVCMVSYPRPKLSC